MSSTPRGIRRRVGRDGAVHWQVRFLVRNTESPGQWIETSKTFPTLAAAKAFKAERDGEVAAGLRRFDPRAGRVSLREIWDHYAETKQPAVSVKTWSGYRQSWKLRIAPAFGNVPVNEITRSSVSVWLSQLTVGPWAKVSTLRLLRCVLEVAVADGRMRSIPPRVSRLRRSPRGSGIGI